MDLYRKTEHMLYNYRRTNIEIKNIRIEIEDIENSFRGIGSVIYDDMPKASNTASCVENEVEKKEQKIDYLNMQITKKENEIKKIDNALESLNEEDRIIIEEFYINNKTNVYIARKIDKTPETVSKKKRDIVTLMTTLIFF